MFISGSIGWGILMKTISSISIVSTLLLVDLVL